MDVRIIAVFSVEVNINGRTKFSHEKKDELNFKVMDVIKMNNLNRVYNQIIRPKIIWRIEFKDT